MYSGQYAFLFSVLQLDGKSKRSPLQNTYEEVNVKTTDVHFNLCVEKSEFMGEKISTLTCVLKSQNLWGKKYPL